MTIFKGFNTIGQQKKFSLTDFELIKRDLLNAFLTREGEVPGRPDLGTKIWNFIFEPLVDQVRAAIEQEVRDIIELDPRLEILTIDLTSGDNTVIVEVSVIVIPNVDPETMLLTFEQDSQTLFMS